MCRSRRCGRWRSGEWLSQVITPGGMRRDGDGFAYTVRVRMIHAHVRQMLWKRGDWDENAWGAPIPQPYMAFTVAEFGHIAIDAMHTLGVRFTDRELDDIYHLWRYVGHVVGMSPRTQSGLRGRPCPHRGAVPADVAGTRTRRP